MNLQHVVPSSSVAPRHPPLNASSSSSPPVASRLPFTRQVYLPTLLRDARRLGGGLPQETSTSYPSFYPSNTTLAFKPEAIMTAPLMGECLLWRTPSPPVAEYNIACGWLLLQSVRGPFLSCISAGSEREGLPPSHSLSGNCMISSFYGREVPTWHPHPSPLRPLRRPRSFTIPCTAFSCKNKNPSRTRIATWLQST